ncbi:MAG: 16S rRNA (cytidine(1402)-2'-O)-methyltransferase [Candidatus Falkowbacteria bacterium]|nr:MAG: 16S rRNA (cytidine(1402)-2'-O)-methyltransferase [Candidatus Falkowbacteria bacterium]
MLRVVGTPIGNLEDISLRALRVFKESDFILCEDTRVTRKLLDNYEIKTPTISYHQHSGELKVDKILALLEEGKNLALVTDAGTPGISDPGGKLVSLVREKLGESVKIESVPGPSALAAAISIAGIGFDRFLFLGFLPHKKGRQTMLKEISASAYPAIVYESKHRIVKLLEELEKFNEHKEPYKVTVCRELTKMFESVYEGGAAEILAELLKDTNNLKGEFVVIIKKDKQNKYEE